MNAHNKNHENHEHKNHDHHKMMMYDFKKRFIVSTILTIPILILSPLIQETLSYSLKIPGQKYLLLLISSFIFFWAGKPFLIGAKKELKEKQPGMMTLISLAISVSYIYSTAVVFGLKGKFFFWELTTLIDIMLLGHWIEMKSVTSASKAIEKLAELMPKTANLIKGKEIVTTNIQDLKKGDLILVKPGEKIPADGTVIEGESYVDESMLTGESKPVIKKPSSPVIGGSINGEGILKIKVKETGKKSYLSKVINLVKQAQSEKSKTEKLADKAAKWLTISAITTGIIIFTYWIIYGPDIAFAIERLATVMVIACPHALGLAIPLVNAVSTSISAKNGLLIRNRTAFENSRKITTLVFDKTGTLTEGKFSISKIKPLNNKYSAKTIIQLAASLEKNSEHPIAKGIINKAKENKTPFLNVSNIKIIKGEGIEGKINNKKISLLSNKAAEKRGIEIPQSEKEIATQVILLENNKPIGYITLEDKIRKESKETITKLKSMNIKCYMLTGDNKRIAKHVSETLKLNGYFSELLPHEKQEKIKELKNKGEFVAMVGDGINDAPALATADIGIAIGSGTDIASETSDIVLVNSNPKDILTLIRFGKKTYNKMIQNLVWATGYNIIAIPLAAGLLYNEGIMISPAMGAFLMSLSTVIVAINAKTLRIKK